MPFFFAPGYSCQLYYFLSLDMASPTDNTDEKAVPPQMIHDEVVTHFAVLTDEELAIEKKLRRKIDFRIMPVVISVYLMNYIDRSVILPPALLTFLTVT